MKLKLWLQQYHEECPSLPFRQIEDLMGWVYQKSWSELQTIEIEAVPLQVQSRFLLAFEKLKTGTPLAYILGVQAFYKSEFIVSPDVLIPRPETEIIVEKALDIISDLRKPVVLDLGTGSGCIGLSLAKERPDGDFLLLDKSPEALSIANQNKTKLGLKNANLLCLDVGEEPLAKPYSQGSVDLFVANPPYIQRGDERVDASVHSHEPHLALYSGNQGLETICSWLEWTYPYLKDNGHYLFEFGQAQEKEIAGFIASTDYDIIEIISDYAGINRFFKLKK